MPVSLDDDREARTTEVEDREGTGRAPSASGAASGEPAPVGAHVTLEAALDADPRCAANRHDQLPPIGHLHSSRSQALDRVNDGLEVARGQQVDWPRALEARVLRVHPDLNTLRAVHGTQQADDVVRVDQAIGVFPREGGELPAAQC